MSVASTVFAVIADILTVAGATVLVCGVLGGYTGQVAVWALTMTAAGIDLEAVSLALAERFGYAMVCLGATLVLMRLVYVLRPVKEPSEYRVTWNWGSWGRY